MAQLGSTFDSNQVEPDEGGGSFEVMAPGDYKVAITKSDYKDNSQNTGRLIALELSILEGEHQGAIVFANLNILNKSQKAQQIGQGQLSAICKAVGKPQVADTEELHNIPLMVELKIQPAKGDYPAKNDVKKYFACSAAAPAGGAGGFGSAAPAGGAAAASGGNPWD